MAANAAQNETAAILARAADGRQLKGAAHPDGSAAVAAAVVFRAPANLEPITSFIFPAAAADQCAVCERRRQTAGGAGPE
ncbi:hypothetical protein AGIG_G13034 [Arapaima gigas]